MSSANPQASKILRIAVIYFVLAWVVVKLVSLTTILLGVPNWVLKWLEVSAYTLFPAIFLILWLKNRHDSKNLNQQQQEHTHRPNKISPNTLKKTLAILPLNRANDRTLSYYKAGLAEDMIMAFSAVPGLTVVSRNATTGDKKVTDLHEIIQRVSLKHVLEGEVIKEGQFPHIRVRLKDVTQNKVLWAELFNDEKDSVFDIQKKIFANVLNCLEIKMPTGDPFSCQTDDFEVYNSFLEGRFNFNQREEGLPRARQLFEEAIELDGSYAPAYAGLANTYNLLGFYELEPPNDVIPKAKEAALKALTLKNNMAEAHTTLAYSHTIYDWDWKAAEAAFERALAINPGYATANHWYAEYMMAVGRVDEAIIQSRQAQKHDPLDLIISTLLGMSYYFSRKFDESVAEGKKTLTMAPDYLPVYLWLGMAYEQKGQYEESIDILIRGKQLTSGTDIKINSLLGHVYAKAGRTELATSELNELQIRAKRQYVSAFNLARINLGLDRKEDALTWLEKGYEERSTWLTWINVDPSFDSLRKEPRFQSIIDRMNFPQ